MLSHTTTSSYFTEDQGLLPGKRFNSQGIQILETQSPAIDSNLPSEDWNIEKLQWRLSFKATAVLEEEERARRLEQQEEASIKRLLARSTSSLINPFPLSPKDTYNLYGPESQLLAHRKTTELEELERAFRLNDPHEVFRRALAAKCSTDIELAIQKPKLRSLQSEPSSKPGSGVLGIIANSAYKMGSYAASAAKYFTQKVSGGAQILGAQASEKVQEDGIADHIKAGTKAIGHAAYALGDAAMDNVRVLVEEFSDSPKLSWRDIHEAEELERQSRLETTTASQQSALARSTSALIAESFQDTKTQVPAPLAKDYEATSVQSKPISFGTGARTYDPITKTYSAVEVGHSAM